MGAALALLTCVGGARPPHPRALTWFPVVGAGLGFALGAWWWVAGQLWPPLVVGALVVAADAAVTGMLHLDGLADSADGLLAHGLDRDRRLAVMAEPTVGAFALVTMVLVVVLRLGALASLAPSPALLVALCATSRAAMAVALATQPGARPGGMAAAFAGGDRTSVAVAVALALMAVAVAAALATGSSVRPVVVVGSALVAALASTGVVVVARRRLGGITGDVLGAAGVVAETLALVAAAARW